MPKKTRREKVAALKRNQEMVERQVTKIYPEKITAPVVLTGSMGSKHISTLQVSTESYFKKDLIKSITVSFFIFFIMSGIYYANTYEVTTIMNIIQSVRR